MHFLFFALSARTLYWLMAIAFWAVSLTALVGALRPKDDTNAPN